MGGEEVFSKILPHSHTPTQNENEAVPLNLADFLSPQLMAKTPWNPLDRLTAAQREQLVAFEQELLRFNRRFNLISRETEAAFAERHILHSLALAHRRFPDGSVVVDWGTGGGLPAIPLAITFPEVEMHAVDAVGKKIQAVRAMGRRLGLANLHPWHGRAEAWPGRAHFSVSRATAPLRDLWRWHARARHTERPVQEDATWPPGLICLKGGDLTDEVDALQRAFPAVQIQTTPLESRFGRPYFAEKYIVQVFDN